MKLGKHARTMWAMVVNSDNGRVFAANPEDKIGARELERKGMVAIERSTMEKAAGMRVWYVLRLDSVSRETI